MARRRDTSPFPLWAQEMSPVGPRPTLGGLLLVALLAVAVGLLAPMLWSTATADPGAYTEPPPCATVWPSTCEK